MKTSGGVREAYNQPLAQHDLEMVLRSTKPSAPAPDGIHYRMLTHLHPFTLLLILYLFNRVWQEGRFPLTWKVAIVIPLLKPRKDASSASSYRLIALTSCLSKTFERIINKRLMSFLE